ncbi:MAG: CHASE3 domain-containing protein [Planctomycetes bacterium]|nr:CHASE3 domain-containing protein [Planctomycetota bacterium]
MKSGTERKIHLGFGAALLFVGIVSWCSYRSTTRLAAAAQRLDAAHLTKTKFEALFSDITDAESSQRGYLITGSEAYLAPYHETLKGIDDQFDELERLTRDHPGLRRHLEQLKPLIEARLSRLGDTLRARNEKGFEAALVMVQSGQGKEAMDRIRREMEQVILEEEASLSQKQSEAEITAQTTLWLVAGGGLLATVLVVIAGFLVHRDFQERTRLAQELQERNTVLQNAVEGISRLDDQGRYVSVNMAYAQFTGYEPNEMIGMDWTKTVHPDDLEKVRTAYQTMLHQGKGEAEARGIRRDGSVFYKAVTLVRLLDRGNRPAGHYFFMKDITDRKQAEQALLKAKEAAEKASQVKSRFLANMSHELRTPLNSVIGFANILMKNKEKHFADRDLQYLERIRDNGLHLLELVNGVLDISQVEAGKTHLEITRVSLDSLIREVLATLEGQTRNKDVSMRLDSPDGLRPFETDERKLRQVLVNLISNAAKFTKKGSVTVRVLAGPETGEPARLDVIDTGIGIPQERLEAIFEAFEQADRDTGRRFGGSGLGLTITRSLCRLMGYRLEVSSEVENGSTFSVIFSPGIGERETPIGVGRGEKDVLV